MFPIQFIQRMQSKIELLDRNGYLSLAKNISLFLSTPREMNTWEHGWRSQVLLFHLRNYIYFFFSWIVAEEDPRWKRDQQRTGVRESLFEGSHPFFFFFRRIFPFIVYYYAYLSLGAGQLPPNLASFVRSLNEIPPHVPIARNGEDWIVLHNGLDSIKGERKRRFCNFHIR